MMPLDSSLGRMARRLGQRRLRFAIYVVLALILALLALFPRPYEARAKVVPSDASGGGITGMLGMAGGQSLNIAALLGDRSATEVAVQIARSQAVADDVVRALHLVGPGRPYANEQAALRALQHKVDIHTLLGGIVEIETTSSDARWAQAVTAAYVQAVSLHLGAYGRIQVERKRHIIEDRLYASTGQLTRAQGALSQFRRQNNLPDAASQLSSQLMLRTSLQAQLLGKQAEIQTLEAVSGPENPALLIARRQISALQQQIAQTVTPANGAAGPNVGALTGISLQYANLYRDYLFAQSVYEVYARVAEEITAQELISQDRMQVSVVDPAHVDAERYFNTWAVATLAGLVLLAFFTEFYAPATGLFTIAAAPAFMRDEPITPV